MKAYRLDYFRSLDDLRLRNEDDPRLQRARCWSASTPSPFFAVPIALLAICLAREKPETDLRGRFAAHSGNDS